MPITKLIVENCDVDSNSHQETWFHTAELQLNISSTKLDEPKSIIKKQLSVGITFHETKTLSKNAVPLRTHRKIVAAVPRIVLHYSIALFKPESDL